MMNEPLLPLPDDPLLGATTRTLREEPESPDPGVFPPHGGATVNKQHRSLAHNYEALIREMAIYYPVSYHFERMLGEGRQGKVFVGLRQGARGCLTRHAIKIFDPSIYSSAEKYWTDMGRIASQVSVLQTLRSPFLVSVDSYDEVNGVGYLQMEVVNGADVRELLSGRYHEGVRSLCDEEEWQLYNNAIFRSVGSPMVIQPGVAVYIMRMLLKGLESLHGAGFIHSDIKPSNAMVDRFGYIKLIDYGRAVKPREKSGVLLGSPLYMAPEVHMRVAATEQSDIYSVGLVGLEMLSGSPPIRVATLDEKEMLRQKWELPEKLMDILPDHVRVNKELVAVLRHFIEPDPARRFPDARSAETEEAGLRLVHKQLMRTGMDADYARMMGNYMARLSMVRNAGLQ